MTPKKVKAVMSIDARTLLRMKPFDATAWAGVVADDCHARVCNEPPALGKSAVIRTLVALHELIEGFGHEYFDSWIKDETVFVETDIGFRDARGRIEMIPCVVIMRATTGVMRDFRVLFDPAPIPGWPSGGVRVSA